MTEQNVEYVSPIENPGLTEKVLASAEEKVEFPDAPEIFDGIVKLLVPIKTPDGGTVTTVEVQELNGLHEERLARVNKLTNLARWTQAVLECGIANFGSVPASPTLIEQLLVGDRDNIMLAIRKATYGSELDYGTMKCMGCNEELRDITIDLDKDIEIRELDGPDNFTVDLRKGRTAQVHLPTGADHLAVDENPDINDAERRSILLSRCIDAIGDDKGNITPTLGFGSITKNLSVPDRNKILDEIATRQPGPQLGEVSFKHDCGFEQPLPVSVMLLFPGL